MLWGRTRVLRLRRQLREQRRRQSVDLGGTRQIQMPGLAGIQQLIGKERAEFVQLQADHFIASLRGADQPHASQIHVADFATADALLHGVEFLPFIAIADADQRLVQHAALAQTHPGLHHLALHRRMRRTQLGCVAHTHQMTHYAPRQSQRLGQGGDARHRPGPRRLRCRFKRIEPGMHLSDEVTDRGLDVLSSDGCKIRKLVAKVQ